ncbi:hypothetical protein SAMN05216238_1165 [Lentibacillus persicus]|uniref:YfhD-like protein n=1 Tax=Lentibacillus persicus TaxID=640948 RepID=A0A1I2AI75_9BACI|nr:hypothetical protein [Lentibacillus persicus]SFE43417.1 hypothetical protein SAMN05216238_1165 [Lentibacillus persicus]
MSEENKNRNKDKNTQNNKNRFVKQKPDADDVELAEDREFLNLENKRNKRHRKK